MKEIEQANKTIAVYSNTKGNGRVEYAINLAAALVRVTKEKVLFVDMVKPYKYEIDPATGIDLLKSGRIKKRDIEGLKRGHSYIVINLPFEFDETIYQVCDCFDVIHFFIDSTKDSLKGAYKFLVDLLDRCLEDIHSKIKPVVYRLNIFDRFSAEDISWLLRRDVWAIVPEASILDRLIDAECIPIVLRSRDCAYSRAVLRIAKKETSRLLGLALGSGAAFGLAHIGVLRVLEEERIPIDVISGSSIGALVASMWGLGFSSDRMERIARSLRNKLNIMRLLDFSVPVSGILTGKRLKGFLKSILGEKTFEDLKIPVKIMVYDLANRETLVIEKGLLVDAVYMSISIPGIFKPKMEQDRMIVDGGVSDPVPVDALLREGAKKTIAVNVMPGPEDISRRNMVLKKMLSEEENILRTSPFYIKWGFGIKNFFRRVFTPNIFDVIMTSMQSMEYMLAENSCKKASVVLRPVFADASSVDFHLVKKFIRCGEEETLLHIDEIKRLVE